MGLMAFEERNIDDIVTFGTIPIIVDNICEYAENRELVDRCVRSCLCRLLPLLLHRFNPYQGSNHSDSDTSTHVQVQTLDNISMGGVEHAAIVIQEGGKDVLEEIKGAYEQDEEMIERVESALLSINALEKQGKAMQEAVTEMSAAESLMALAAR